MDGLSRVSIQCLQQTNACYEWIDTRTNDGGVEERDEKIISATFRRFSLPEFKKPSEGHLPLSHTVFIYDV